jgi:Ca2+-binding EF-hand superfamily protein
VDEIQRARYDRVFDAYAYDGYITWEGFDRHTRILAEIQGRSPDATAIVSLREELRNIWESLATMADSDHDGRINRDEWRVSAEGITASLREAQEQGVPWPFDHWVEVLYRAIDSNGDGKITKEEYTQWLAALRLADETDIDSAFIGFDTNQDGTLSMDEFSDLYHQYWSVFDPSVPGHRWIGP